MPLSDTALRHMQPRNKPYKVMDGRGLYVLVQINGSRLWRFDFMFKRKRKTMAFGKYPAVGLAAARAKRDEARLLLDLRIDPAEEAKRKKAAAELEERSTFGVIAAEHIGRLKHDGAADATIRKNTWLLQNLAAPLRDRPIRDITPIEIVRLLQRIEQKGHLDSARRLREVIGAVFRLAVQTARADTDRARDLKGATRTPRTRSRAALVNGAEVGALLRAIDSYGGYASVRAALEFTALTAARPGEVRAARWLEINLAQRRWTIPKERTKMRREHVVPLSDQAITLLLATARTKGGCDLVFPAKLNLRRMLSDNTMNAALRRMGYSTKDQHCSHGFRSTFSTILNEHGHDPEVIELCLAHQDGSVRAIYNRARKWNERVAMMQAWADLLDDFRRLTRSEA